MANPSLADHLALARERTLDALRKIGAQGIVASSPANIQYLSGYRSYFHSMNIVNQSFAVLTKEGKSILVVPSTDADFVAMGGFQADEVHTYGTFYLELAEARATQDEEAFGRLAEDMVNSLTWSDALKSVLEAEGLAEATITLDQGHMMASYWEETKTRVPEAKLLDGFALMRRVRAIKTPYERELLRRSSLCSERAIEAGLNATHTGATDVEIRNVFEKSLIESGAEHLFSAIAVGSRTALPNVIPDGSRLELGGIIRFDAGGYYQGYASDLARIGTLGEAPDKVRRYYQAMLNGEEAGMTQMRPGVPVCKVFDAAVEGVRRSGVPHYQRHHCGHGIGLEMYEPPIIRPQDTTPLEEGMTFCIETPYYELGLGGIQVEDMVVITAQGPELLTRLSRELFELKD